jgi:uncharacterized membrane protein YhaH (DUF805 family)
MDGVLLSNVVIGIAFALVTIATFVVILSMLRLIPSGRAGRSLVPPGWVWVVSCLIAMSTAGNQEDRPGSDGADAVTGDFTFLVLLIVLLTLLVRSAIRRGRKQREHNTTQTGPGPGSSRH